jgi:hypothetical protein
MKSRIKVDDRWQGESWNWFGLSYASWLVISRLQLQSMPVKWQKKFFNMVQEMEETVEAPYPDDISLTVSWKRNNKFVPMDIPSYRHNILPLKKHE